jgi:hypothetical protein
MLHVFQWVDTDRHRYLTSQKIETGKPYLNGGK